MNSKTKSTGKKSSAVTSHGARNPVSPKEMATKEKAMKASSVSKTKSDTNAGGLTRHNVTVAPAPPASGRVTIPKSKWYYHFGSGVSEGNKDDALLLGGKGANLAEMCAIGVPAPRIYHYDCGLQDVLRVGFENSIRSGQRA